MRKLTDDSQTDQPIADPREVQTARVGTPVRDAAVDPDPAVDFLPPINAGQANPHGPDVVAPGIHALETKPVLPGDVSDVDRQQARETELADRVLVHDEPVPDTVQQMAEGAYDYKVDAADPQAEERSKGQGAALADSPAAAPVRPQKNDSTGAWRTYAVQSGAMTEQEAADLRRDAIIARVDGDT